MVVPLLTPLAEAPSVVSFPGGPRVIQPTRAVGKRQLREVRVARAALGSSPRLPDFSGLGSRPPLLVALHFPPLYRLNSAKAEGAHCSFSSPALPSYPPGGSCLQPVTGARWAAQNPGQLALCPSPVPSPTCSCQIGFCYSLCQKPSPPLQPSSRQRNHVSPFLEHSELSLPWPVTIRVSPPVPPHTHCSVLGSS